MSNRSSKSPFDDPAYKHALTHSVAPYINLTAADCSRIVSDLKGISISEENSFFVLRSAFKHILVTSFGAKPPVRERNFVLSTIRKYLADRQTVDTEIHKLLFALSAANKLLHINTRKDILDPASSDQRPVRQELQKAANGVRPWEHLPPLPSLTDLSSLEKWLRQEETAAMPSRAGPIGNQHAHSAFCTIVAAFEVIVGRSAPKKSAVGPATRFVENFIKIGSERLDLHVERDANHPIFEIFKERTGNDHILAAFRDRPRIDAQKLPEWVRQAADRR